MVKLQYKTKIKILADAVKVENNPKLLGIISNCQLSS